MDNFTHYLRFMQAAATLVSRICPVLEYGPGRVSRGSTEQLVYLFWTDAARRHLFEVTVKPHLGPSLGLARIHGNRAIRHHKLAMVQRLGLPVICRGRYCIYSGYARLAPFSFELSCLESELPELAALAVAMAQGQRGRQLAKLPGAHLVEKSFFDRERPDYGWTVAGWTVVEELSAKQQAARAHHARQVDRGTGYPGTEQPAIPIPPPGKRLNEQTGRLGDELRAREETSQLEARLRKDRYTRWGARPYPGSVFLCRRPRKEGA